MGVITRDRLSLNLITVERWSLSEALVACRRAGVSTIGVWRAHLDRTAANRIAESGIRVSGLCRGGFIPAAGERERAERHDDNRKAIVEAAEIGAKVLVMVCGPAPNRDLPAARRMVADGIERLVPFALEHGITLGIEPLHPMMIGERSVIVTLAEAIDLVAALDPRAAGLVVDAYHVFWDPRLETELQRARGRIVGFHVSDWLVPTTNVTAGRGMMGDGIIDLRRIRGLVEESGYDGPIEVEIINPALAKLKPDRLLELVCDRFTSCV